MNIEIPSQLRKPYFRFVKLKGKKPFEDGWNIPEDKVRCLVCDENNTTTLLKNDRETIINHFKQEHPEIPIEKIPEYVETPKNYSYDSPTLQEWLKQGGNYGICCGAGHLIVIDCDSEELEEIMENAIASGQLPETFKVRTGSGKAHYYYTCTDARACALSSGDRHIGDIRAISSKGTYTQVVAPGSIHPDTGKPYVVENDTDISQVTWIQIQMALGAFMKKSIKQRAESIAREEKGYGDFPINVVDIVPPDKYDLKQSGDEFYGCHPVHGSERTMRNFWINPKKNVWHCFRHNVGGGPISLIAMLEGIIDCEDVQEDWLANLPKEKKEQLFKILKEKYGIELKPPKERKEKKLDHIKLVLKIDDKIYGYIKVEIADKKHLLVSAYKVDSEEEIGKEESETSGEDQENKENKKIPKILVAPIKVKKDWLVIKSERNKVFSEIKKKLNLSDDEIERLIRIVQMQFNKKILLLADIEEEREKKEKETPKDFNVEEALKSPTLFQDIYESLGKIIVGNPTVRKNVVYDLAAIGAPKIVLGNPDKPVRSIRSHSAVWVVGPAESGKSTLLKLIYEIAPKAHWITRITEAALDRGFAEKIDNGVLIIPEGDIIYRTTKVEQQENDTTKKIIIPAENVITVQLRMVIEDNMLCLVSTEKGEEGFYTVEEMIPVHPTVFIGSTSEPEEEQLKTRFKIYRMEKSAALSLEVMKRVIDGLLWKEQPGKYHPDELKAIYHAIYDKVMKLKAIAIPREFEEDLMKIAMRLCTLFVPKGEFTVKITEYDEETGEEREREILLTRDELVEKIMKGEIKYEEMLTILEQMDSDERLNRRFEDIIRRIVASACLHVAQRKVENDVLYVDKQDIEAGYDLLEDIEKEFAPKPSLTELILEILKEQYQKDKTRWLDANEVAQLVFKRLNEEITKSRVDKVRRLLKYLVDKGRISRKKSGNKYVYIYKVENDNDYDDWLDSLLND